MQDKLSIKELLIQGSAYSEVRAITGASAKAVSDVARRLEDQGHTINRKTDEERRRSTIRQMPIGEMGDVLDQLTQDELEFLMGMSLETWADAAANSIKELHLQSE